MFLVTKIFKFDAAHNLINYNGVCEFMHGHTYTLEVTLQTKKLENGISVDFNLIKQIVNDVVISKLDHNYINNLIQQPTAENICIWIWQQLKPIFSEKVENAELYELKLFEGHNSYITYRG